MFFPLETIIYIKSPYNNDLMIFYIQKPIKLLLCFTMDSMGTAETAELFKF